MSEIRVRQAHNLGIEGAKSALGAFESYLAERGTKLAWNGPRAEVKGPGVSGAVVVTEAEVDVSVKLGMLAKAAGIKADKLEASIAKRLSAALQPEH
jgi:putative polyhydroxyalkanoate system protein